MIITTLSSLLPDDPSINLAPAEGAQIEPTDDTLDLSSPSNKESAKDSALERYAQSRKPGKWCLQSMGTGTAAGAAMAILVLSLSRVQFSVRRSMAAAVILTALSATVVATTRIALKMIKPISDDPIDQLAQYVDMQALVDAYEAGPAALRFNRALQGAVLMDKAAEMGLLDQPPGLIRSPLTVPPTFVSVAWRIGHTGLHFFGGCVAGTAMTTNLLMPELPSGWTPLNGLVPRGRRRIRTLPPVYCRYTPLMGRVATGCAADMLAKILPLGPYGVFACHGAGAVLASMPETQDMLLSSGPVQWLDQTTSKVITVVDTNVRSLVVRPMAGAINDLAWSCLIHRSPQLMNHLGIGDLAIVDRSPENTSLKVCAQRYAGDIAGALYEDQVAQGLRYTKRGTHSILEEVIMITGRSSIEGSIYAKVMQTAITPVAIAHPALAAVAIAMPPSGMFSGGLHKRDAGEWVIRILGAGAVAMAAHDDDSEGIKHALMVTGVALVAYGTFCSLYDYWQRRHIVTKALDRATETAVKEKRLPKPRIKRNTKNKDAWKRYVLKAVDFVFSAMLHGDAMGMGMEY